MLQENCANNGALKEPEMLVSYLSVKMILSDNLDTVDRTQHCWRAL